MYYRVAIQVDASPTWKWKSTALSSLNILFHWLQYYRVLPHDRLRIFSSSSQEAMHEQLVRENQGLLSTSVPATQFLQERRVAPREVGGQASADGTRANERMTYAAAAIELSLAESITRPLGKRREELEHGAGGDHNLTYRFTLPSEDLQREGSGNSSAGALPDPPHLLARSMTRSWHDGSE